MTAAMADASVVVDASTPVVQSGSGDDLKNVKRIFAGTNIFAEAAYDQMSQALATHNFTFLKRLRLLQSDVSCDIDANQNFGTTPITGFDSSTGNPIYGPFVAGDCHPLDFHLDWALSKGLSPHVPLASFMPPSFATPWSANFATAGAERWSASELNRFKQYAHRLVSYIVNRSVQANAPSVVFEISNELDIAESGPLNWNPADMSHASLAPLGSFGRWLWWIDPTSYNIQKWPIDGSSDPNSYPYSPTGLAYPYGLDVRRLDHGISPVHQIFAQAVTDVEASVPSTTKLLMAGPAFAGNSFLYNPDRGLQTLEEDFLDQILNPNDPTVHGTYNSRLDRFSFHYYGSSPLLDQRMTLTNVAQRFQAKICAIKGIDQGPPFNPAQCARDNPVRLFVSEWGPTVDESGDVNYSHKGAAWAAAFLLEAVAANVDMGSYLMLEDGTTSPNTPYIRGQASLFGKDIDAGGAVKYYPKPAANVFEMFDMMTGARNKATVSPAAGAASNLQAFASTDGSSAHLVVVNYNGDVVFKNDTTKATQENVSVTFDNLPFNGLVTVQRYLVDANTSNFAAFFSQPNHPSPALQCVEQFTAQVLNGHLLLPQPSSSLGLGVSYWQVTSQSSGNPSPCVLGH